MAKTSPYPLDFRRAAVRLLRSGSRPASQLARELGCSPQSLRSWNRELHIEEGRLEDLTPDEREELRRLRRLVRAFATEPSR